MDLYGDLPPTSDGSGTGLGFVPSSSSAKPASKSTAFTPMTFTPAARKAPVAPPPPKPTPTPPAPTPAPKPAPEPTTTTPSLSWGAKRLAAKFANRPATVMTSAAPTPSNSQPKPSPASSTTLKTSLGLSAFTTVSVTRKSVANATSSHTSTPTNDDDDEKSRPLAHANEIRDEYDPTRPNDYMLFCEERKIRKKQEKVKRDLEKRQERLDREREKEREQLTRDIEAGRVPTVATTVVPGGRGRGMNLPAWMTKKIEEKTKEQQAATATVAGPSLPGQFEDADDKPRGLGFVPSATTPSSTAPTFVSSTPQPDAGPTLPTTTATPPARTSRFGKRVSRFDQKRTTPKNTVLLLQNMVGPGQVDDDLQEEVKEECQSKYGPVVKCLVYEVTTGVPATEAVRIFVEFVQEADAAKGINLFSPGIDPLYVALVGLNGRFFAGRKLHVSTYPKEKFDRLELAP
ncbi:hypothetical protein THRCLA_03358 [Thraustotheca clavata]|uniref:RRM domain-containing protein n=1 Tax=Thraustotheca clavata TaxID=74557 RepID=A0A1W0A2G7_9STRA|nr:hypothetical protein THRCLA_03358 [Thraustotheca clavata]